MGQSVDVAPFSIHPNILVPSSRRLELVMALDIRGLGELRTEIVGVDLLGIEFLSHQEAVGTSTPAGRILFQVIGAMAEFEREIIRERVVAGLRQARKNGKKLGRVQSPS